LSEEFGVHGDRLGGEQRNVVGPRRGGAEEEGGDRLRGRRGWWWRFGAGAWDQRRTVTWTRLLSPGR
jgi:hypothetical protein